MPSSATITAFYTMVAGNRAKASEANTNWSAFRGHLIPVNPDTQTSSNQLHDLGATDHNWRRLYLKEPPFVNNTQLGKIRIPNVFDGSTPPDIVDDQDDLSRVAFPTSHDTDVRFQFIVPDEYVPGNRIALTLKGYPETSGSAVVETTSRLYKMSITSANSAPSAAFTTTSTLGLSTGGLTFEDSTLKLTNSTGIMNGTTVTVGDVITVALKRKATATSDTNTGYLYLTDFLIDLNN
jgi:hypothetical protein